MIMTLSKALRYKKKLLAKIAKITTRLSNCISAEESKEYSFIFSDVVAEYDALINHLTELKVAIQTANIEILPTIYKMAELKSKCQQLENLNLDGLNYMRYGSGPLPQIKYQLTEQHRSDMVEKLQNEIEKMQDEIEAFNASKTIKISDLK